MTTQAATDNIVGSAPSGLLASLGDVLIGGARRFIDIELNERAGSMPTQADLLEEFPDADLSQPQTMTAGFANLDPMTLILIAVGGAIAFALFK